MPYVVYIEIGKEHKVEYIQKQTEEVACRERVAKRQTLIWGATTVLTACLQATNDSLYFGWRIQVVCWGNLCNVNVVWSYLTSKTGDYSLDAHALKLTTQQSHFFVRAYLFFHNLF